MPDYLDWLIAAGIVGLAIFRARKGGTVDAVGGIEGESADCDGGGGDGGD